MAKADRKEPYKRLPVRDIHKVLAAVTLKDPNSGQMWGLISQTQPFGGTAAALHYYAVSRVMATIAVRWLKIPCLRLVSDFGVVTTESTIPDGLKVRTTVKGILGVRTQNRKIPVERRVEISYTYVIYIYSRNFQ